MCDVSLTNDRHFTRRSMAKKTTAKKDSKLKSALGKAKSVLRRNKKTTLPVPAGDPLSIYMREVGKIPLLTREEEKSLALRVYDQDDSAAARKLTQSNLRFVIKVSMEYARYGAKLMDLIQEGNMGLLHAVREFNPYKEVRLTTYAVWWIRSYIQDYLLRNWSVVRIGTTKGQKKLFYRLKKIQDNFERQGISPSPKAIAHELNVREDEVELMQKRMSGGDVSLNAPLRSNKSGEVRPTSLETRVMDSQSQADHIIDEGEQKSMFAQALLEFQKGLSDRELVVFKDRMLSENPMTLIKIGEMYNISKERSRQIEANIKKKLKDFLDEKYPDISIS